ncbi:MAG: hypothetical protein AMXMBFR47_35300 [Planctomycetota bacterium]
MGLFGLTAFGGDQTPAAKSSGPQLSPNPISTSASAAGAMQVSKSRLEKVPAGPAVKAPVDHTTAASQGGGPAPRDVNDNCADAIQINCGDTITGNTAGNTTDGVWPCAGGGGAEQWYTIVAGDPVLIVDLCGSSYDTAVMVLDGCGGTVLGCNDDFCGLQSTLTLSGLTVGNTYWIAVGGYAGNTGAFSMTVTCGTPTCPGSEAQPGDIEENEGGDCGPDFFNGGCNSSPPVFSPLACGQSVHGTSGTNDALGYRDTDWWLINVPAPGAIMSWTVTANFPVLIGFIPQPCPQSSFITGTAVTAPACTEVTSTTVCLPPGQYVAFVAPSTFTGVPCGAEYRGTLTCTPCEPPPGPENNACADAIGINCGDTVTGDTTNSTTDGAWPCAAGGSDLWYSFVAADPVAIISLCGSSYDTAVMVLDGCGGTVLGCNDDFCGLQSQLTVSGLTVGNTYWIAVGGFASGTGAFTMTLTCGIPPCPGSDAQPGDIEENEGGDCGPDFFNGGCNSNPPVFSPIACGQSVHGTSGTNEGLGYRDTDWWLFEVTGTGAIVNWTVTANFPVLIGFIAQPCPQSSFIPGTNFTAPTCTELTSTTACLPPGQYVAFVAPSSFTGVPCGAEYRGTLTCTPCEPPPGPENDACADAIGINCGDTVTGDTTGATTDGGWPCAAGGSDLWYSFVAADTVATLDLCASSYDTAVMVLDGCGGTVLGCNDDFCGLQSTLSVGGLTVGQTYYVAVGGFAAGTGAFSMTLTCGIPVCEGSDPQPGDIEENEGGDCGADFFNGGCNSVPPVFSPIACGQSVHGTSGTNDAIGYRDTDWWLFDVTEPNTVVTWTVTGNFPTLIGFVGQPCPQTAFLTFATAPTCTPVSVTLTLQPGQYVAFVAPSTFTGVICGAEYRGTLTADPCEEPCLGDLDNDGDRDITDLAILLSQFGSTGGTFAGDIDGDGDVDIGDLAQLLSVFGVPC